MRSIAPITIVALMALAACNKQSGDSVSMKNATVEASYVSLDGDGVAALIHFPSPVGVVYQSEHFEVSPATRKITRLRSYYDPRKLLA